VVGDRELGDMGFVETVEVEVAAALDTGV